MPRYYHGGGKAQESKEAGGTIGGSMDNGNVTGHPGRVVIPPMHGGGTIPFKKNGIIVSLPGCGYWHIGPGEYVELPDYLPVSTVKSLAPQLLTKEEAMAAGLCNEDGSIIKKKESQPEKVEPKARG